MLNKPVKKVGCCTLCDKPVFEILTRFPQNHMLAREPRKVGAPLDNAMNYTFVLLGGETIDVAFCDKCEITEADYPRIWEKILNTFRRETSPLYLKALNVSTTEKAMAEKEAFLLKLVHNPPILLLIKAKWSKVRYA